MLEEKERKWRAAAEDEVRKVELCVIQIFSDFLPDFTRRNLAPRQSDIFGCTLPVIQHRLHQQVSKTLQCDPNRTDLLLIPLAVTTGGLPQRH